MDREKFNILSLMGDLDEIDKTGRLPQHVVDAIEGVDPSDKKLVETYRELLQDEAPTGETFFETVRDAYAEWIYAAIEELVGPRVLGADDVSRLAWYLAEEVWFGMRGGVPEWPLLDDEIKELYVTLEEVLDVDALPPYADVYDAIWPGVVEYEVEKDPDVVEARNGLKKEIDSSRRYATDGVREVMQDIEKARRILQREIIDLMDAHVDEIAAAGTAQEAARVVLDLTDAGVGSSALFDAWDELAWASDRSDAEVGAEVFDFVVDLILSPDPRQQPLPLVGV